MNYANTAFELSKSLYPTEVIEKAEKVLKNAIAIIPDCSQILSDCKDEQLGKNKAKTIDGKIYVPCSFFENHLNCKVQAKDNKATVCNNKGTWSAKAVEISDTCYIPAYDCCKALGYNAFEGNNLFLISNDKTKEDITKDRILSEAICGIVAYRIPDFSKITHEDYKKIKDRWRYSLIADENIDLTDKNIKTRVQMIERQGESLWKSMNRGDDIEELWGEKVKTSDEMRLNFIKIYEMAKAWGTYGCKLYHNDKLREDILYALDWMYKNRYGEAEKTDSGWRSLKLFNWWDWMIGTPVVLMDTLVIMEGEISRKTICDYLSLVDLLIPKPKNYAANRLNLSKIIISSAILQENAQRIILGRDGITLTLQYVDGGKNEGQGFCTDGSFVYHIFHPMNGLYGSTMYQNYIRVLTLLDGTPFELCNPMKNYVYDWTYKAIEPIIYRGYVFRFILARYPERVHEVVYENMEAMIKLSRIAPEPHCKRIKSIIKYIALEDTEHDYPSVFNISEIMEFNKIMNDESVEPRKDYIYNITYSQMDKVIHQHENYGFGLSMSSSRIYNYESINQFNKTGWYISDGMTCLFTQNDKNQYDPDYWEYVNPYRMPGTTVNTEERQAVSVHQKNEYLSSKDFVGGVTMDERYGTSAMFLESYHGKGIGDAPDDGYGGPNPPRKCSLEAKKSWFMFDDEIVALGSGINAKDNYPVLTVADNRKLLDEYDIRVQNDEFKDGTPLNLKCDTKWICLENQCGYYFPESQDISLAVAENTKKFMEIVINHGVAPNDEKYSYVLLPNKTSEETQKYSENPSIEILSNNDKIQCVRNKELCITGYVFWESGKFFRIEVSCPAIVMTKKSPGKLSLCISDPTQKLRSITLKAYGKFKSYVADYNVQAEVFEEYSEINVNSDNSFGKTYKIDLIL